MQNCMKYNKNSMQRRSAATITGGSNVPESHSINLKSQQNGQELPTIADQHAVADAWQLFFHSIFNRHRGDILTSGGDQNL